MYTIIFVFIHTSQNIAIRLHVIVTDDDMFKRS